jgi:hypothetical protein
MSDSYEKAEVAKTRELKNAALAAKASYYENLVQKNQNEISIKRDAMKSARSFQSSQIWKNRLTAVGNAIVAVVKPLGMILRDLSPYIALAIVFMIMAGALRGGKLRAPQPFRKLQIMNKTKSTWQKFKAWFKKQLQIFMPGYKLRALSRILNPFAADVPSNPRPIETYGRCDNTEWRQTGGNKAGLCVRTYKPDKVTWTLDVDKMPELSKLPTPMTKELQKNGERLQIYIPWALQGTFYVPQCSKAYFVETDKDGKQVQTPAAHLLKDKGLSCERLEKASTQYGVTYRPKSSQNKYDIATKDDPKCTA